MVKELVKELKYVMKFEVNHDINLMMRIERMKNEND